MTTARDGKLFEGRGGTNFPSSGLVRSRLRAISLAQTFENQSAKAIATRERDRGKSNSRYTLHAPLLCLYSAFTSPLAFTLIHLTFSYLCPSNGTTHPDRDAGLFTL